jgi:hypothetical protein
VRPADGHNGCHLKGPNFGDLGMSPRQLAQNMAYAHGRLVTRITLPATGNMIAPKRFVGPSYSAMG